MKDNGTPIADRLFEIQTELLRISRAIIEANKPLGIALNGRPAPGIVERSHQELYDISTRISGTAKRLEKVRAELKQKDAINGTI